MGTPVSHVFCGLYKQMRSPTGRDICPWFCVFFISLSQSHWLSQLFCLSFPPFLCLPACLFSISPCVCVTPLCLRDPSSPCPPFSVPLSVSPCLSLPTCLPLWSLFLVPLSAVASLCWTQVSQFFHWTAKDSEGNRGAIIQASHPTYCWVILFLLEMPWK